MATWAADLKPEPLLSKEKVTPKEKAPLKDKAPPRQAKAKGKKCAVAAASSGAY